MHHRFAATAWRMLTVIKECKFCIKFILIISLHMGQSISQWPNTECDQQYCEPTQLEVGWTYFRRK